MGSIPTESTFCPFAATDSPRIVQYVHSRFFWIKMLKTICLSNDLTLLPPICSNVWASLWNSLLHSRSFCVCKNFNAKSDKIQKISATSFNIQHSTFNFLCLRSFVINQRNTTYSKQGSYGLYAESPPWRWWRWWRLYIRNGMYRWIIMCYKRIVGMIGFFKQIRSRRWGLNSFMRSVDVEGRFKHIYFFDNNSNKHDQNIFDS